MLENCRWLLYVSRCYGCHPHTIDERSRVPASFRLQLTYSLIMFGAFCLAEYYVKSNTNYCDTNVVKMGCTLQDINRHNRCAYMILTTFFSFLRHAEFERAVAASRKFDDLMRHHSSSWCIDNKRINFCIQWLIILTILIVWIVVFILMNFSVVHINILYILILIIMRITFSVEIVKFCFLYDALYRRFRRLNGLCRKLTGVNLDIDTDISAMNFKHLTISNLQRLHNRLIDATNHFNSYYSLQLLAWMACMLLDTISYVFVIIYGVNNVILICGESLILLILTLQITAINYICNLTCNQANALAETIFLTKTLAFKQIDSSLEMIELGVRMRIYPLRIRVCGLFNLDNRLAFTAFGVILMYVVLASSVYIDDD